MDSPNSDTSAAEVQPSNHTLETNLPTPPSSQQTQPTDQGVIQPNGQISSNTAHGHVIDISSGPAQDGGTARLGTQDRAWEQVLPQEIRDMIWDIVLESDPNIANPRTIKLSMNWNPSQEGCGDCGECTAWDSSYMNSIRFSDWYTGPMPGREHINSDGEDEDEEAEEEYEEEEDLEWHSILNDDHHHFRFRVQDSTQVQRSEQAASTLWKTCPESRARVRALWRRKGRGTQFFKSFHLQRLCISPSDDIFHLDLGTELFAPVMEWLKEYNLDAAHDVGLMSRFQIDYSTFQQLAEPVESDGGCELRDLSQKFCFQRLDLPDSCQKAKTSLTAVFRNASSIYVLPSAVFMPHSLTDWQSYDSADHQSGIAETFEEEREVMDKVREGDTEFKHIITRKRWRWDGRIDRIDRCHISWAAPREVYEEEPDDEESDQEVPFEEEPGEEQPDEEEPDEEAPNEDNTGEEFY